MDELEKSGFREDVCNKVIAELMPENLPKQYFFGTDKALQWYEFMTKEIGNNCKLAPLAKVYEQVLQKYGDREGLGVPESHSVGMAGNVSEKQARIVQREAWEMVHGKW